MREGDSKLRIHSTVLILIFQFLFILSYYTFIYSKDSASYFQKFKFLEYGFKKNAQFSINFQNVFTQMVFGLATKKEINEINKLKDLREYCTGKYQLSALQYNITLSQRINGEVKTKSILTPYAFTCDKNYSIYAKFEINNGNSNSDYRCEYMLIATIIFSVLVCCVTVFSLIYFICKCRSNTTKRYTFLILFIFIGITTINFMAVKCFSAIKNSESEYLNEKTKQKVY